MSLSFCRLLLGLGSAVFLLSWGSEVNVEEGAQDQEADRSEKEEERRFKVGELVEFWESTLVRGHRTDMSSAFRYLDLPLKTTHF